MILTVADIVSSWPVAITRRQACRLIRDAGGFERFGTWFIDEEQFQQWRARPALLLAAAVSALEDDQRCVYVAQCRGPSGPVKIGVAVDVATRIAGLQTSTPYPLTVISVMPGGWVLEQALHRRFARLRIRGEWFRYGVELWQFLDLVYQARARVA